MYRCTDAVTTQAAVIEMDFAVISLYRGVRLPVLLRPDAILTSHDRLSTRLREGKQVEKMMVHLWRIFFDS